MKNKEFWRSNRGKSLIKLLIWFLFIIIVYVIFTFGMDYPGENIKTVENQDLEKEEENETSFDLSTDNFQYSYIINLNNDTYTFSGLKEKDKDTGSKIMPNGEIINYEKIGNVYYQNLNDNNEEITDLFTNLKMEFLNYNILAVIIKESNCEKNNCNFTYNEYQGIYTKTDTFINVVITKDNEKYNLSYTLKPES